MASLIVKLTADASGFKGAMDGVNLSLDSVAAKANKVSGSISSLGASLSVAITAPILAMGASVIKASADMDNLKRALESTAGSAKAAEDQFARLKEVAKLPGIGLTEAVKGSISLQNYGLSAALAEKALRAFSNAVAAAGGSADDTQESLRQLGQLFGRGKVTQDNLRIILERVPQAAAIIRKEFGSDALADPAKAFEALGINSEKFTNILIDRLSELKKVSPGLKTELENLGQEIQVASARIGDKLAPAVLYMIPILQQSAGYVADLADAFTRLDTPTQAASISIAGLAIAAGPVLLVFGKLSDTFTRFNVTAGSVGAAMGVMILAVDTFNKSVEIAGQVKELAFQLERLASVSSDARKDVEFLSTQVSSLGGNFPTLGSAVQRAREELEKLGSAVMSPGLTAFKAALDAVNTALAAATGRSQEMDAAVAALAKRTLDQGAQNLKLAADMKNFGGASEDAAGKAKAHALALGALSAATNKIIVDSVAGRKAIMDFSSGFGVELGATLSSTSLVYVEHMERIKAGVSRAKDAVFDFVHASDGLGRHIELANSVISTFNDGSGVLSQRLRDNTRDFTDLAGRSDSYAESLKRLISEQEKVVANDNVRAMTLPPMIGVKPLPTTWTGQDALNQMGIRSDAKIMEDISRAQARLAEVQQSNRQGGAGAATGNDVIKAQQHVADLYREISGEAKKSGKAQSEAWKQVSTIATDLSRGIANAGVGLLFSKGAQVDVQKYKDEISALEEEQRKLLVSQSKGNDVTKQLAANSAKLADVNKRMADEVKKASFGFRAFEAGKSIVEDLAKSITRVLIEGALKSLAKSLLGIQTTSTNVFGGIASQIGGLFGSGGTGVIKSAVPGVTAIGLENGGLAGIPGISGSVGGAASAGASGIAGIVGAVGSVVSAISGVIGNFQFAHMNTALGRIEENTRYVKIWTGEQSQSLLWCAQKSTEYLGYAVKSLDMIGMLNSQMLGTMQAGGGAGGTTINMSGAYLLTDAALDDFIERFSRRLKTQGL
jgi:tape measure domain-containing protein